MKYIRMANNIYELFYNSEFEHYEAKPRDILNLTRGQIIISEAEIGKYETANTIEELCDEIVSVYGETHTIIAIDISPKKILHNMKGWKVEADIYGAIWTGKGLIYVAKLNDKRELELI